MRWACISSPPLCRLILDAIKDMRERAQADRKQRIYSAWQTRRSCGRHRVEPWSERKGRGVAPVRSGLPWWSASAAALTITARVFTSLSPLSCVLCALSGCSQPVSQPAIAQPGPLSMPTGLALILDAASATAEICKFGPARIWELPVEPSILFALRAICRGAFGVLFEVVYSVVPLVLCKLCSLRLVNWIVCLVLLANFGQVFDVQDTHKQLLILDNLRLCFQ